MPIRRRDAGRFCALHSRASAATVHGTTMSDICQEADLSLGAVYNYFDSKAEITHAIAEESRGSLEVLFEALEEDRSAPEVLSEVLLRLGAFVEQPGDAEEGGHRVRVRLWSEALRTSDVRDLLRENQETFVDRFAGVIRDGQVEGTVNEAMVPVALARALIALHQGMVLQAAVAPDEDARSVFDAVGALIREAFP